ncbi:MAG: putative transcriptional regulator [Rhodobacteraceae bacterium HLUCCA08]|nr:MAG: putative transcriptional regulator [Rhodobacteraceae bacterium HLUCCA08]
MAKSPDAFRTISEVADWLDTPAHVLRFWESKFSQVKPVKRAGGRRYYRPEDMALLGGIKKLLHDDGMTIKGVQKLLREQGVRHVGAMAPALPGEDAAIDMAPSPKAEDAPRSVAQDAPGFTPPAAEADMAAPAAAPETPEAEEVVAPATADEAPAETDADAASAETQDDPADDAGPGPDAAPASGDLFAAAAAAEPDLPITRVVPLQGAPDPAPDADLSAPTAPPPQPAAAPAATALPDWLARDPADSDSKAEPRILHLLEAADPIRLRARAADLTPVLTRMAALRDRMAARR